MDSPNTHTHTHIYICSHMPTDMHSTHTHREERERERKRESESECERELCPTNRMNYSCLVVAVYVEKQWTNRRFCSYQEDELGM